MANLARLLHKNLATDLLRVRLADIPWNVETFVLWNGPTGFLRHRGAGLLWNPPTTLLRHDTAGLLGQITAVWYTFAYLRGLIAANLLRFLMAMFLWHSDAMLSGNVAALGFQNWRSSVNLLHDNWLLDFLHNDRSWDLHDVLHHLLHDHRSRFDLLHDGGLDPVYNRSSDNWSLVNYRGRCNQGGLVKDRSRCNHGGGESNGCRSA